MGDVVLKFGIFDHLDSDGSPLGEMLERRLKLVGLMIGHGVAGSPSAVRDYVGKLHADSGVNYVLGQMMFGTLSFEQASSSMRLFAKEVIPAFAAQSAA
jgi:hypothetical protein